MRDEARAARIWQVRERTEHEAASLFATLASDLAASDAPSALTELASRCAEDERAHAILCRAIIDDLYPELPPLAPDPSPLLGPPSASAERRALYTSVALGCVTESLSTALLLEIRKGAERPSVRHAVGIILEDEVRHARLGWAHLAYVAAQCDVRWLAPSIPGMLRAALATERPDIDGAEGASCLAAFGILRASDVERICRATVDQVIRPGLAMHGIDVPLD